MLLPGWSNRTATPILRLSKIVDLGQPAVIAGDQIYSAVRTERHCRLQAMIACVAGVKTTVSYAKRRTVT